jgi:hypothetical protein
MAGFSRPFEEGLSRNVVLGKLATWVFPASRGISLSAI